MKRLGCFFLTFLFCSLCAEEYAFFGKHFLASYLDCNPEALGDVNRLIQAMDEAVRTSGATVLNKSSHVFEPNGLTLVYLLSESHASIHTYPEFGACFVDLFTCGELCSAKEFDRVLRRYLQPGEVNARHFLRGQTIEEFWP